MSGTRQSLSVRGLTDSLHALGIRGGDRLLVHSSLRSLGQVERGADGVVDALLETLGPKGLLVVPTFTYFSTRFDPAATPGRTGAISEALRRRVDAVRSLHPFYSVAAVGHGATALCEGHEALPGTAIGSPIDRLAREGGFVLLLGVGQITNTTVHVGEFHADASYVGIPFDPSWPRAADIALDDGSVLSVAYDRFPGCSRAFGAIEWTLRRKGTVRDGLVGRSSAQLVPGRAVIDATLEALDADPAALLCTDPHCYRCTTARRKLTTGA